MELVDKAKMMRYKALFEKHMSDPLKLRLAVMGAALVIAVVPVYMPLSKKIDENKRRLAFEKERNGYIIDCEKLQKEVNTFRSMIGEKSDTNEWANYLLDGIREFQVKLKGMESKQQRKVGPYKAISFGMEIEGTYPELKKYVEWLESSPRLIRIDTLNMERRSETLLMKIIILGVVPK